MHFNIKSEKGTNINTKEDTHPHYVIHYYVTTHVLAVKYVKVLGGDNIDQSRMQMNLDVVR
jgi:hypothetical protein